MGRNAPRSRTGRTRLAIAAVVALAVPLVVAACGGDDDDGGGGSDGEFVVGHTYPDLQNPYYISVRDEVEQQFADEGIEYVTADSTQDPSKQVTDAENLVTRGVDLLFIDAVDPEAVTPAYEAASAAEIPVVALIREPTEGEYESLVFLDSIAHGRESCQFIVDQLGSEGNVVELQGILATQPGRERSEGCNQALDEAPGIELVAQQEGDFERVAALNAMEDIIQAQGADEIDAVFGANDEEALGAIEAFKAAGVDPSEKVIVGIDGTEVALEAMCKGELSATLATIGREEGDIIVDLAERIRDGEEVEERIEFPGVFVTPDNLTEIIERSGYDINRCPAAK